MPPWRSHVPIGLSSLPACAGQTMTMYAGEFQQAGQVELCKPLGRACEIKRKRHAPAGKSLFLARPAPPTWRQKLCMPLKARPTERVQTAAVPACKRHCRAITCKWDSTRRSTTDRQVWWWSESMAPARVARVAALARSLTPNPTSISYSASQFPAYSFTLHGAAGIAVTSTVVGL